MAVFTISTVASSTSFFNRVFERIPVLACIGISILAAAVASVRPPDVPLAPPGERPAYTAPNLARRGADPIRHRLSLSL